MKLIREDGEHGFSGMPSHQKFRSKRTRYTFEALTLGVRRSRQPIVKAAYKLLSPCFLLKTAVLRTASSAF